MRKVGYKKLGMCPYTDCTGGTLIISSAGTITRKYGQTLMICSCGSYCVRTTNGYCYPLVDANDADADVVVAVQER